MHTFKFHSHDFGDDTESVWVAAWVDGVEGRGIGAYVDRAGEVSLGDNVAWHITNDLSDLGIDPESDEAVELVRDWRAAARQYGTSLLDAANT